MPPHWVKYSILLVCFSSKYDLIACWTSYLLCEFANKNDFLRHFDVLCLILGQEDSYNSFGVWLVDLSLSCCGHVSAPFRQRGFCKKPSLLSPEMTLTSEIDHANLCVRQVVHTLRLLSPRSMSINWLYNFRAQLQGTGSRSDVLYE